MTYSLEQEVPDGPITAPRWLHHLVVKVCAQHAAPTLALTALTHRPVLSALIGGPGVWALITLKEFIKPSDPEPLTLWQHVADWLNDSALSLVPLVVQLIDTRQLLLAGLLAAYVAGAYVTCHRDARP